MNDDLRGNRKDGARVQQDDAGRLPPPAFPSGQRMHARPNHRPRRSRSAENQGDPANAFPDGAFISPDDPLPKRREQKIDPNEVVVTGIGGDPHLTHEKLALTRQGDPIVSDLAARVGRLADELRDKGEAALRATPDMTRFEATLRAYCVGYLTAERTHDDD